VEIRKGKPDLSAGELHFGSASGGYGLVAPEKTDKKKEKVRDTMYSSARPRERTHRHPQVDAHEDKYSSRPNSLGVT